MPQLTVIPGITFTRTPQREALAFIRRKRLRVGFDFLDVWRAEHATAFTVAKAM